MTSQDLVDEDAPTQPEGRAWTLAMLALGAVVLAAYSSFRKPIWIDEFLHFSLGGLPLNEAWDVVTATTVNVNHGQTGVYMMLDWLLLQVFGPSAFALRLPSLVAAAGLLAAGVWFLRLKGCSPGWQTLGLLALGSQTLLMHHAGDARPYMPLAASTIGMLTYYSVPVAQRTCAGVRVLGVVSFLSGALMHAYFPLMLALMAGFTMGLAIHDGELRVSVREVLRFLNPALLLSATTAYLVIGQLTWMRGSPDFAFDPYVWLGGPSATAITFFTLHMEFLIGVPIALLVTGLALLSARQMSSRADVMGPAALVAAGLLSSATVTLASIARSYWVFPRQWVVGIALVALGTVWLFFIVHRAGETGSSRVLRTSSVVFRAVVVGAFFLALVEQGRYLVHYSAEWEAIPTSLEEPIGELTSRAGSDQDEWVRLANINVKAGNEVWPELAEFYRRYIDGEDLS